MLTSRRGILLFALFVCVLFSQMAAVRRCDEYMYSDAFNDRKCEPCYVCYSDGGIIQKDADCPKDVKCRVDYGVFIGCPELEYKTEDKPVTCSGFSMNGMRIFNGTCHVQCDQADTVRLRCQIKDKGLVPGQWLPTLPSCVRHIPKPPQNSRLSSSVGQSDKELSILAIIVIAVSFGIVTSILISVTVIIKRKRIVGHPEGCEVEGPPEGSHREGQEHEDVTAPLNPGETVLTARNPSMLSQPSEDQESFVSIETEADDDMEDTQPKEHISQPVQAGWSCESCSSLSSPGSTLLYARGDSSTSGVGSGISLTSSRGPVESSDSAVLSSGISYDSSVVPSNGIPVFAQHNSYRTPTQHPRDVSFVRNMTPQENEDAESFLESDVPNSHFRDIELHTGDQTMVHQYNSNTRALGVGFPIDGTTVVPREHSCYSEDIVRPDSGSLVPYSLTRVQRGTNMATEHAYHSSSASQIYSESSLS